MEPVTAIGSSRDADAGFRKKYGPKSTDSLTFSIARIMEPDVRRQPANAVAAPAADYFHALESAFKKYVPAFRAADATHRLEHGRRTAAIRGDDRPMPYRLATNGTTVAAAATAAAVQLFHYQQLGRQPGTVADDAIIRSRSSLPPPPPVLSVRQPPSAHPVRQPPPPPPPPLPLPPPTTTTTTTTTQLTSKSVRLQSSRKQSPPRSSSLAAAVASSAKTFTCNHCGKVFYAHYNLTRHMPVHTGARPFICKVINVYNSL